MAKNYHLVLASASPFRRDLLTRLGVNFTVVAPDIDESPQSGERPDDLVIRLAREKAEKIAVDHPDAIIIGSDQVACLQDQVLGKPGDHPSAVAQLQLMRGQKLDFLTSLCVLQGPNGRQWTALVNYEVRFRNYTDEEIEHYLLKDRPYQCAGSFKSENLGITMIQAMTGPDPTALIGLPLLKTAEFLRECGLKIP